MTFEALNLIPSIAKALTAAGYTTPTPIQAKSIPVILEGHDLFGCAQTGTGKTASFAIPTLQLLATSKKNNGDNGKIKALILTPTRELAIQIGESFATYGKFTDVTHTVIFGGVGQAPQVKAIRKGVDVVIATPGRLIDLINQKYVNLGHLEIFILDEADRMLDMGFIHDIKKVIAKLPNKRQSLFFSATMPAPILELAHTILRNPMNVAVTPVSSTVKLVEQSLYFVEKADKKELLVHILKDTSIDSALVFTRTKHGADKVTQVLAKAGIAASAIHGNKSQTARQAALQNLKSKKIRVLVATDIAARGIDINELSHVFIYDIPTEPETYVHRIGRTGRAGAQGVAIAFCDNDEKKYLREIIKVIKQDIPIVEDHPFAPTKNAGSEYKSRDVGRKPAPRRAPAEGRAPRPDRSERSARPDARPARPAHSEVGRPIPRSQTRAVREARGESSPARSFAPQREERRGAFARPERAAGSSRPTSRPMRSDTRPSTRGARDAAPSRSNADRPAYRGEGRPETPRGPRDAMRRPARPDVRAPRSDARPAGRSSDRPATKSYQKSFHKGSDRGER